MANNTTKTEQKRNLSYLNRDFQSLKRDLTRHLKTYFPDTNKDFNESSVGMMLTELVAYVGDNFSFYLDKQFNESFTHTALERKNVFKHAQQLGFKPFGKTPASGKVNTFLTVPARTVNEEIVPDTRYAGIVKKGAKLKSRSGDTYETLEDIDFSEVKSESDDVSIAERDPNTNEPVSFTLRMKDIDVVAGETKSTTFATNAYKAFKKFTVNEDDVTEILSVQDSELNDWFEVEYLAQDTVFASVKNTGGDSSDVPYVLKLKSVPRRFVTEFDIETNRMSLIFGSGDSNSFDGELIPNAGDLAIPLFGKDEFTEVTIDPQNFLKTRTLGLAPVDTTLTVNYRAGAGSNTNAGAGELDTVAGLTFDVADTTLDNTIVRETKNSFSVRNESPIQGGSDELTLDEIKQLIPAIHSSQARAVTIEDYIARSLSIPQRFGSMFRAFANKSSLNKNAVELHVLSKDSDGNAAVAPNTLKQNLKRYLSRFRMLTDAVEILDGEIINIAIKFKILSDPDFNSKAEILENCLAELKDFFDIDKQQINQPINITKVHRILSNVPGVLSVYDLEFFNRVGTFDGRAYSNTSFNIEENTENGIIYSKENAIFEVKYHSHDLIGSVK